MFVDALVDLAHSCATPCAKTLALQWRNLPSLRGLYRRTPRWVFTTRHTKNTSGGGQKMSHKRVGSLKVARLCVLDTFWFYILNWFGWVICYNFFTKRPFCRFIQTLLYNNIQYTHSSSFFLKAGAVSVSIGFASFERTGQIWNSNKQTLWRCARFVLSECFILTLQTIRNGRSRRRSSVLQLPSRPRCAMGLVLV